MEQIYLFFKYLLTSNTINFALMVIFLYWVLKKVNLANIISQGITKVKDELSSSKEAKETAGKDYVEAQKDIENLPNLLKSITDETMASANIVCANYETETNKTVNTIRNNVPLAVAAEERKISSALTSQALEKTVNSARGIITSQLLKDDSLQAKFVEQSLKEFEGLSL